jgi:hypothetical protein
MGEAPDGAPENDAMPGGDFKSWTKAMRLH